METVGKTDIKCWT